MKEDDELAAQQNDPVSNAGAYSGTHSMLTVYAPPAETNAVETKRLRVTDA